MEWTIGEVVGGAIVGAVIGVLTEPILSVMAASIQPVAKEVVKSGCIVVDAASELLDEIHKEWSSIMTEAQAELKAQSTT